MNTIAPRNHILDNTACFCKGEIRAQYYAALDSARVYDWPADEEEKAYFERANAWLGKCQRALSDFEALERAGCLRAAIRRYNVWEFPTQPRNRREMKRRMGSPRNDLLELEAADPYWDMHPEGHYF